MPAPSGKGGRKRKILSTKVDLTPMVDLGFLLITFFIFSTKMSEAKAMALIMPKDDPTVKPPTVGESSALTVIPASDNKIFYYHGSLEVALKSGAYGITSYAITNGIGDVIREKLLVMERTKPGSKKDMMLMIKPDETANCRNIVDVLDEVTINGLKHYALMGITKEEKEAMAGKLKSL